MLSVSVSTKARCSSTEHAQLPELTYGIFLFLFVVVNTSATPLLRMNSVAARLLKQKPTEMSVTSTGRSQSRLARPAVVATRESRAHVFACP